MKLSANHSQSPLLLLTTLIGALSGLLQAIGLMQWVFVVPVLAQLYTDPNASGITRAAVGVVYQAVHQYGGVVIGEYLGQTLLMGWTLGLGWAMRSSAFFKSWVVWGDCLPCPYYSLFRLRSIA